MKQDQNDNDNDNDQHTLEENPKLPAEKKESTKDKPTPAAKRWTGEKEENKKRDGVNKFPRTPQTTTHKTRYVIQYVIPVVPAEIHNTPVILPPCNIYEGPFELEPENEPVSYFFLFQAPPSPPTNRSQRNGTVNGPQGTDEGKASKISPSGGDKRDQQARVRCRLDRRHCPCP